VVLMGKSLCSKRCSCLMRSFITMNMHMA
jgi:hypothetical protein